MKTLSKYIPLLFFLALLVSGIAVYENYGVTWDEPVQRENVGKASYDYVFHNNQRMLNVHEKYYGPFYEVFLYSTEKLLNIEDTRQIYLFRHLVNFLLFFLASIVFYLLLHQVFQNRWLALLSVMMLVTSPRIFSHSFFNTKDLAFMCFFIFALATMWLFLKRNTLSTLALHALMCGILVQHRLIGALLPAFTLLFFLFEKGTTKLKLKYIFLFIALICATIYTCWPFLWRDPYTRLTEALQVMSSFHFFESEVLFNGINYDAGSLPWYYLQTWIAITTPITFLVFVIVGTCVTILFLLKKESVNSMVLISILLLTVSFTIVWIMKPILYDAWRHFFFLYPLMIILAIVGVKQLVLRSGSLFRIITILVVSIGIVQNLSFIIKYHPHEQVYFNLLAGKKLSAVKSKFDLDYWGASYRAGLEYIVQHDNRESIKVFGENDPCAFNLLILPLASRDRIQMTSSIEEADYFLTNFRWHDTTLSFPEVVYEVKQDDASIMTVFKVNE